VQITLGLGEVEWQVMGHNAVVEADLPQGNLLVGVSQFLKVVVVILERVGRPP